MACAHHQDSTAKIDIDRRVAALVPTEQPFAPPVAALPKPIAVGQWTLHKVVNAKGEPSLLTYKIVGEDGDAYWVEVADESYFGKKVTKMLVSFGDRSNPSNMEIRSIKVKDSAGNVSEIQANMIPATRSSWQEAANLLVIAWQGLPREDVHVVAGNFAGCFRAPTSAQGGGTAWAHPIVPITGLVRIVSSGQPSVMELIGFGDMGATSEIP
jgi:hypothetical protein